MLMRPIVAKDSPVRDDRDILVNGAGLVCLKATENLAAALDEPEINFLHQVVYGLLRWVRRESPLAGHLILIRF
jgi:hypothetical protein